MFAAAPAAFRGGLSIGRPLERKHADALARRLPSGTIGPSPSSAVSPIIRTRLRNGCDEPGAVVREAPMSSRSMKRVALVTGCSSGFGLLSALELAKAGFRVFASMRKVEKRATLDRAAAAAGVDLEIVSLDVTKSDSIVQAMDRTAELAGPVDVLVNNAGIETWGTVEEQSLDETRMQLETNFFGTVALI